MGGTRSKISRICHLDRLEYLSCNNLLVKEYVERSVFLHLPALAKHTTQSGRNSCFAYGVCRIYAGQEASAPEVSTNVLWLLGKIWSIQADRLGIYDVHEALAPEVCTEALWHLEKILSIEADHLGIYAAQKALAPEFSTDALWQIGEAQSLYAKLQHLWRPGSLDPLRIAQMPCLTFYKQETATCCKGPAL